MTKKSEMRDRLTPYATVAAVILSLLSLWLTIYWHRQEVEDRVLVRVGVVRSQYKDHSESPEGYLSAQVVNIGARPIYIRKVELMIGNGGIPFFSEDDLAGASGALKLLAPGEEANFKMPWDFSQHPVLFNGRSNFYRLTNKEGKDASASVYVETTRASIDQPANIYEVTDLLTNTLPPKPALHPPSWRPQPPVMKSVAVGTVH
jgi:hypothetical protein